MSLEMFILDVAICLIYAGLLEPLFHEFGHALAIQKIEGSASIVFYVPFAPKFRIIILGIEVFNVRNKAYKNITYSKYNFQGLNDLEIKKMAKAGVRNSLILAVAVLLITIRLNLWISCALAIAILFTFIYAKHDKKRYTDFSIIKNRKEFRYRMKEDPTFAHKNYANLLKEYEK